MATVDRTRCKTLSACYVDLTLPCDGVEGWATETPAVSSSHCQHCVWMRSCLLLVGPYISLCECRPSVTRQHPTHLGCQSTPHCWRVLISRCWQLVAADTVTEINVNVKCSNLETPLCCWLFTSNSANSGARANRAVRHAACCLLFMSLIRSPDVSHRT